MGHFGKVTRLSDLPSDDQFVAYVRAAAQLNRHGVKKPDLVARRKRPTALLSIPDYFEAVSKKNKKAAHTFRRFSYTNKKEYVDWVTEAKREETRQSRLKTTIEWLVQGRPCNWKYMPNRAS
jgi:uncharacterized protein YdeI (YjbR/CyaY-like superfamily)